MSPETSLLFEITPAMVAGNFIEWLQEQRDWIQQRIHQHGGILCRGFDWYSASEFKQIAQTLFPELLEYHYQSTPRTRLGDKVYTSTEYPKHKEILLHSELSYSHEWPGFIMFFSIMVAATGGQTPIANNHRIYEQIPAAIRNRFEQHGILYVRNYHPGIDLSWQQVFQTSSKSEVESYCRQHSIRCIWLSDEVLRTEQVCQAALDHPLTKERVWFNQAHLFHSSNATADERRLLQNQFKESDLPRQCYLGNGDAISENDLAVIRAVYAQEKRMFDWQRGDVMILDNMLMCHGREPFTGERKVIVAMA